jgi:hypothetical protein
MTREASGRRYSAWRSSKGDWEGTGLSISE